MAKITFTQLESLATESVNLSSIVPIVQDGENYKIALSSIDNSDPNWDSTYTSVQTNSASWGIDTVYDDSLLQSTSATWDNTSSAVQTNSAQWAVDTDTIYDDSLLQSTSGSWDSTYTIVGANSASWDAHTDPYDDSLIQSTSGSWDSSYTTVNANSASWDTHTDPYDDSLLQSTSGSWDSTYTAVAANSASWDAHTDPYDDAPVTALQSASATWDNTSSAVQTNSAQWAVDTDTIYDDTPVTALQSASATWDNTYTVVGANSATNWSNTANTLDSVTTNGATTTNDIEVGGFKMPTGATDSYVLTTDASGVGTWQAAGGGPSGTTLSGTTSAATPTEIFVDGTSPNRVDVATGSTITFSALVAARSATESAGYKIEGVIKNDAGTAALVGVVAKTVFAEEDIAWDITVTAANNALTFIVTGDSADSVSWEVTLNKTEAT